MTLLVRRSNVLVPADDAARVADAWRHDADAVTLDLVGRPQGRAVMRDAIRQAGRGGAEVFARIDAGDSEQDLQAAVAAGLRGIMLIGITSREDIERVSAALSSLEKKCGMQGQSIELIAVLETARSVWEVRALVTASRRISQVVLDEAALANDLGIELQAEYDPFVYARGRVITEAIAARVSPVGMSYPLSALPAERPATDIHAAAMIAKNTGMKGVVCPYPSWVAPVNQAYTPAPELVEWNRRVREAFAAGVAAGTAAVPLDGKMIDVPVDEWAIVVLAMADACAARDAQKKAAVAAAAARD